MEIRKSPVRFQQRGLFCLSLMGPFPLTGPRWTSILPRLCSEVARPIRPATVIVRLLFRMAGVSLDFAQLFENLFGDTGLSVNATASIYVYSRNLCPLLRIWSLTREHAGYREPHLVCKG
jgi:hypothetical protein